MKAGILKSAKHIEYQEIELPEILSDSVLIKIKAVGICGSDIPRYMEGRVHFFPIILGHEFSGEVVDFGNSVTNLKKGDRVTVAPLLPCMECHECKAGHYAQCNNYRFIGSSVSGAFSEYISVPVRNVVKFGNKVPFNKGAFFEPSTVALHGLLRTSVTKDKNVIILGAGTIGVFTMQWAKILGAKSVTVVDIKNERLQLAKKLGCDNVINSLEGDIHERTNELTEHGFDIVMETAGSSVTIKLAFELVKPHGEICYIGTPTKEIVFSPNLFELVNRKEFSLTGSWMSYSHPFPGKEWLLTAEKLTSGELIVDDSFIYKEYPLKDISEAFEEYEHPSNITGKILLKP